MHIRNNQSTGRNVTLFEIIDAVFDIATSVYNILFIGDYDGVLANFGYHEDSELVDTLFNIREMFV